MYYSTPWLAVKSSPNFFLDQETAIHQAVGPPVIVPIVPGAPPAVVNPESAVANLKLGALRPALVIAVDEFTPRETVGPVVPLNQNLILYQLPGVTD